MLFNIAQFKNTPAEIEAIESVFRKIGPEDMPAAWEELDDYFYNKTSVEDRKYFYSLFRWYTDLTWKMLTNLPSSMVIEIACGRQIPTALLLDFDVHKYIMDFLGLKAIDEAQMVNWYTDMQTNFLTSEAVLGRSGGKDVTVADAVRMIQFMQRPGATSIEAAETSGKIQEILFPKGDTLFDTYFYAEPQVTVERFIDLVNFFLGVSPDRIWYMVDSYINPEKYEALEQIREARVAGTYTTAPTATRGESSSIDPATITTAKLSYADIRSAVDSAIPADANDASQVASAIAAALENLAEEYKDPRIVDLYYFDESSGDFRWNEDLINSQK